MNRNPKSKWNYFWEELTSRLVAEVEEKFFNYLPNTEDAIRFHSDVWYFMYNRIINYNTSTAVMKKIQSKLEKCISNYFGFSSWENAKENHTNMVLDDRYWAGKIGNIEEAL